MAPRRHRDRDRRRPRQGLQPRRGPRQDPSPRPQEGGRAESEGSPARHRRKARSQRSGPPCGQGSAESDGEAAGLASLGSGKAGAGAISCAGEAGHRADRIEVQADGSRGRGGKAKPVVVARAPEPSGPMPIWALGQCQCRWPIGNLLDPPGLFCAAVTDGSSWCPVHERMVYTGSARPRPDSSREQPRFAAAGGRSRF